MIADEPLSGLDAVSARLLLEALCVAAQRGATVLLSVHQPTARFMRATTGAIVMASGGRLVYAGPVRTPTGGCALSAAFDAPGILRLRDWADNAAEAVLEVMADPDEEVRPGCLGDTWGGAPLERR
jgi:ABC-type multidrug transport system ATPase subunit